MMMMKEKEDNHGTMAGIVWVKIKNQKDLCDE